MRLITDAHKKHGGMGTILVVKVRNWAHIVFPLWHFDDYHPIFVIFFSSF
jgi:hypothetical protein